MRVRDLCSLVGVIAALGLVACSSDSGGAAAPVCKNTKGEVIACPPDGGSTDTASPQQDAGGDTGGGTEGVGTDNDTVSADSDTSIKPDVTVACSCAGKQCGKVACTDGTEKNCGSCPANKKCNEQFMCVADTGTTGGSKKFGEQCGPNKTCQLASNATQAEQQAYYQCLNDQCETGRCLAPYCSNPCQIQKDDVNNATGENGPDGIEDEDAVSDCVGAATGGPAGEKFKCVDLLAPNQQQTVQLCIPGTTFKACQADSDCPADETCSLQYIKGVYTQRCSTALKNLGADKKTYTEPGAGMSQACNDNPITGDAVSYCKNDLCFRFGIGCANFCKTDEDCVAHKDACSGGKCKDTGATCTKAADCSPWSCQDRQLTESDSFKICFPKTCYLNKECNDSDYFCRTFYNGVSSPDGDKDPKDPTGKTIVMPGWDSLCLMKPAGGVKLGEKCDPYPSDTVPGPTCENPIWCMDGSCSSHCKADSDCAAGQKCGTVEIPLDLSDPADDIDDVFLPLDVCYPLPSATTQCDSIKDCKDTESCRMYEHHAATSGYELTGMCITAGADAVKIGEECGQAANATLCDSGFCLNSQDSAGKPQKGYCTENCQTQSDCPASFAYMGQVYKTTCRSLLYGWNGTKAIEDNLYVPLCLPTDGASSLDDCETNLTCATQGEACIPLIIAGNPDQKGKVEFRCMTVAAPDQPPPTKQLGNACDPSGNTPEVCVSALCANDVKPNTGYCSALCAKDDDCKAAPDMICDDVTVIPRANPANAIVVKQCRKKASCIPCTYDFECTGDYVCGNAGGPGLLADYRCMPPCKADDDCAKTDAAAIGGTKCVELNDAKGKATGISACKPSGCKK